MSRADKDTKKLSPAEKAYIDKLFDMSYDKLYRVAYRHLSKIGKDSIDDVIQETFRRACENFQSMASYDSAEAWVVNVCHYVAVDEVKRLCRIEELKEESHPAASQDKGLDEILPNTLSASDRDLLDRYYVRRETANEIAHDLGEAPATIRQRLSRLRKELRKLKYL